MNNFNYFQPTDIRFGCGRLNELGDTVLEIGKKCILVTVPVFDARTQMAWADTLAGLSIANAGVTLPHGIGMAIGGCCSHVMHGEALATIYPEFILYTYSSAIDKFARLARLLDNNLVEVKDSLAAEKSHALIKEFLKKIKMNISLKEVKVDEIELDEIAEVSLELPDYTNNPRVADINEIKKILNNSYDF